MLKRSWVQQFVLMFFCFFLLEILVPSTLGFVTLGIIVVSFKLQVSKLVRNILALGIFASYWLIYGKIIDPEVGLNFLVSIIVLKILERESLRDEYMIFFGLILLISAGTLFERNISYVVFFFVSFIFLIREFYSKLNQKWRLKDLSLGMLWVLPLTFALFLLIPRVISPIPFEARGSKDGEIGYTTNVNISQIESLSSNNTPVFQAKIKGPVGGQDLYWRGNTLSYTDGWNWMLMGSRDNSDPKRVVGNTAKSQNEITQSIRLLKRSDYFFTLNRPIIVKFNDEDWELTQMLSLPQNKRNRIQRYEVYSDPKMIPNNIEDTAKYLDLPIAQKTKSWIRRTFKGETPLEIQSELVDYFKRENFIYSFNPGRSSHFEEFMKVRKNGLCSHYASALAIILRAKQIPARLVSGYMGGGYNRYAESYIISENDAHVWVEAIDNGRWVSMDPTLWLAPDRINLGGEAFMETMKSGATSGGLLRKIFLTKDIAQWFAQWDLRFYAWLEEMDHYTQEAWLERLKIKREWLFTIIPLILVLFIGLYIWFTGLKERQKIDSLYQKTWRLFYLRLKKEGLVLNGNSISQDQLCIENSEIRQKDKVLEIWRELIHASFSQGSIERVLEKIRKL